MYIQETLMTLRDLEKKAMRSEAAALRLEFENLVKGYHLSVALRRERNFAMARAGYPLQKGYAPFTEQ